MGKIIRKNRQNCQNFFEKSSLEFFRGGLKSNLTAHLLEHSSVKSLVLFWSSQDSSLFRKMVPQSGKFCNYVRAHYVIGHDVIGHPEVGADNSGVDLSDVENRLAIHSLHKMLWLNQNGMIFTKKKQTNLKISSKILSVRVALNNQSGRQKNGQSKGVKLDSHTGTAPLVKLGHG